MSVKPIPEGYSAVTPYLIVDNAARAIDFYTKVLGATERMRMPMPDGRIGHAELSIGDSMIMLADMCPEGKAVQNPNAPGASSVSLYVYVKDVDKIFANAKAAGAVSLHEVKDQFYGDRTGAFQDPFGHVWNVATHVEDVAPGELRKRMEAAHAKAA